MKNVLLTTTALTLLASAAFAEVTTSGSARIAVRTNGAIAATGTAGQITTATTAVTTTAGLVTASPLTALVAAGTAVAADHAAHAILVANAANAVAALDAINGTAASTGLENRLRINFGASGETDGGLTFGASTRLQILNGAAGSVQGNAVWISNGTATLTVGNTSGAIGTNAGIYAVGGCGFSASNWYGSYCANVLNQANGSFQGSSSGGTGPNNARLSFALGSANVAVSSTVGGNTEIGANFNMGSATVFAGYDNGVGAAGGSYLGVSFDAGSANMNVLYHKPGTGAAQWIAKASMAAGAGSVGVFIANDNGGNRYGLNYGQSLGGGASAMISVANQTVTANGVTAGTSIAAGLTFGF